MFREHFMATSLARLAPFVLFAIFFFGAAVSASEWPGAPLSLTNLWHSPILMWAHERGGARLPLWYSFPATGLPYWATSPGGTLFADPFVQAASAFGLFPRLTLWLLVASHFVVAGVGAQRWLEAQKLPSGFALLGSLMYTASPLFLSFSTNGFMSLATIAALLPWLALHLSAYIERRRVRSASVLLIFGSWTVLVAGWSGLVAALLAAWSLAVLSSDGPAIFSRLSDFRSQQPFGLLGIFLLLLGVGAVAAFPRLEFRFHSMEVFPSAPPQPRLSPLGIFLPEAPVNDLVTFVPYYSIAWAMLLAAALSRWRQISLPALVPIFGPILLIGFASGVAFWLHDGEPLRHAAILGMAVATALAGLLLCRAVATDLWQNLRRTARSELGRQARWLLTIAVLFVLMAAGFQLGLLRMQPSSRQAGFRNTPSQQGAAESGVPLSASAAGISPNSAKPNATTPSHTQPLLRQGLILLFLSALYLAAAHGLPLRSILLALIGLVLVDLRTSHVLVLHTTPSGNLLPPSHAEGILTELSSDRFSRILLSADSPVAAGELMRSFHPVINVPASRLPLSFARAVIRLPLLLPQAPARISQEAQWIYLGAAGTRWILATTSTLSSLPSAAPVTRREDPWVLVQLSPKPMRAQVWLRATRVHDAIQSLALTLNREWPGDEIYVEGSAVGEFPTTQAKGNLGSAQILWDAGNDIGIEGNVPLPSFLAIGDATYPGWNVWADGKPQQLLRANGWMRAVFLSPGRHLVRFVYQPSSFRLGAFVTMLSFVAAILWLFSSFSNRRNSESCS